MTKLVAHMLKKYLHSICLQIHADYVKFLFEKRFLRKECDEHSIVCISALMIINKIVLVVHNLVPRSHSVTGNVRSGKVRQYTIFHWLLKKGCGNAIYAPIGLFRGTLNEGLVFASSCAVLNKCQLCGGKFCFFRRQKSFTVEENHFKDLRRLCKWYQRKPHVPCHSNKVLRSLLRGTQKLINAS